WSWLASSRTRPSLAVSAKSGQLIGHSRVGHGSVDVLRAGSVRRQPDRKPSHRRLAARAGEHPQPLSCGWRKSFVRSPERTVSLRKLQPERSNKSPSHTVWEAMCRRLRGTINVTRRRASVFWAYSAATVALCCVYTCSAVAAVAPSLRLF